MDAEARAAGREKVRDNLWGRLAEAGMQRPKGMTVEGFAGMQARLADRLAYMTADNLTTLAEIIIDHPQSSGRCWSETLIRSEAKRLQQPPPTELPIVRSWLASVEGPIAIGGGYAVELFRLLKRTGRPPSAYDLSRIQEQATDNARQVNLITGRIARNVASPDDKEWLMAYQRDRQTVLQIVSEGEAKRDRQEKGDAA